MQAEIKILSLYCLTACVNAATGRCWKRGRRVSQVMTLCW